MNLAFVLVAAVASGETGEPVLTQMPFTYVLDYGSAHVNSPEYIASIAKAPPTLLHLGKDVPFTHNWGPIQALGGENQAYGRRRPYAAEDFTRRLSPGEVRQRVAELTRLTSDLHRAGVKWVAPYICSMTIGGRPETRAGFWEFYDHWNDYAAFGLGPRPAADPFEWMQRTAAGELQFFYTFSGPFYPPYEPNVRYAVCQNRPEWRTWTEKLVENIARCGFDGVFVDNGASLRCYCPACRAKWRPWIAARWSESARRTLFGAAEPEMGEARTPGLLWAETCRFWSASLAEHLAAVGRAGSRVLGRPFLVFPNGGERRPEQVLLTHAEADLVMFERSVGPQGTNPGVVLWPVVEDIVVRKYNDNIFENKFVQCLRRKVRPIMLTRPGYQVPQKVRKLLEMTPDAATLGCAETAAFGGGGGFLVRLTAECREPQAGYRRFMEGHASLWEGLDSLAEVGVAVLPEQVYFGNTQHQRAVRAVTGHLLDAHVLFDYVIAGQFRLENLRKYKAVVLAQVTQLSAAQDADLRRYVEQGGGLVILGPLPERDEKGLKLDAARVAGIFPPAEKRERMAVRRVSQGRAAWTADVPAESSETAGALADTVGRELAVLSGVKNPAITKVRVNAFQDPKARRWILHLVNYNVPLGVENRPAEVQGPLEIRLPLTAAKSWRLVCYDPTGKKSELAAKHDGQSLSFTVPEVRVHKIVEITERIDR